MYGRAAEITFVTSNLLSLSDKCVVYTKKGDVTTKLCLYLEPSYGNFTIEIL